MRNAVMSIVLTLLAAPSMARDDAVPPPSITVEGSREHRELERQVDTFVKSAITHNSDWSLARWRSPICPLVAGMSREKGEYMLARISEIARQAGAPLGPAKCHANLMIVVTREPEKLLERWWQRDPQLFDTSFGVGKAKQWLHTARPVRAWYNSSFISSDGTSDISEQLGFSAGATGQTGAISAPTHRGLAGEASRLKQTSILDISSVIVVVDSSHLDGVSMGQLTDYVAMVGMAEMDLDRTYENIPTLMKLFSESTAPKSEKLTHWDEGLLHALYAVPQSDSTQISEMQTKTLQYVLGAKD